MRSNSAFELLSVPYDSERLCAPIYGTNSMTNENQVAELGGVHAGDEAELARMGYKQELKCVPYTSYPAFYPWTLTLDQT